LRSVDGCQVREIIDHWDTDRFNAFVSETDKLPRNVIQYVFDFFVVAVRPSGTEPKLKFYCQILPEPELTTSKGRQRLAAVTEKADRIALIVYRELLLRIGVRLDEPALLLPDIVDLARKMEFQVRTVPALHAALTSGKFRNFDECLQWLKTEASLMTPGADPLPALKAPVAYLSRQWSKEGIKAELLKDLSHWALQEKESLVDRFS